MDELRALYLIALQRFGLRVFAPVTHSILFISSAIYLLDGSIGPMQFDCCRTRPAFHQSRGVIDTCEKGLKHDAN